MKNEPNKTEPTKSKALAIFEYVLLIFYLGVIILRVIYTEGPTMQTNAVSVTSSDILYSLYVSTALLFSFILWLVFSFSRRRFSYRATGIELGLCIFAIAAVISGFAASDKRLAINNIVSLFTPIFCAILLVQIIDSASKFRLLLVVIAVLGVVSVYQCIDQLLFINPETVKLFENNPDSALKALNIQPGTLQEFLYKQRIYSDNARAYFTTKNSAGSFLLIAYFAALALVTDRLLTRKSDSENQKKYYLSDIIVIILIFAVFLTKSKGAIIGLLFAMSLLALYLRSGTWLKNHRKAVLALFVIIIIAGVLVVSWYGLTYKTLPGGNSMLVRWQYWHASAKMFMAHFWTGVGPGNFSIYYPYYKPAESLESVADPHNFALSILTQYGIFGLAGFLMMIFIPLWKITDNGRPNLTISDEWERKPVINNKAAIVILCIWFGLLLGIFSIVPGLKTDNIMVVIYIILRYFLPPVAIFIVCFLLIERNSNSGTNNRDSIQKINTVEAILFCALLGFLLHNLTDYAIFELSIYTAFWFILAALIAINANNSHQQNKLFYNVVPVSIPKIIRPIVAVLMGIVLCALYLNYALLPVARSTEKINLANEAFSHGAFEDAHNLLDSAAKDDKLSPYALSINAQMYIRNAEITPSRSYPFLLIAQSCLRDAIKRNDAGYQNFEDLSEVFQRLSEVSPDNEKAGWADLAFEFAAQAVDRYPGSGRLHFNMAQFADKIGKKEIAIEQYNKAVDIENQYRAEFHRMYPDEEIVSRLGEDRYQFALKRSKELTDNNEG